MFAKSSSVLECTASATSRLYKRYKPATLSAVWRTKAADVWYVLSIVYNSSGGYRIEFLQEVGHQTPRAEDNIDRSIRLKVDRSSGRKDLDLVSLKDQTSGIRIVIQ